MSIWWSSLSLLLYRLHTLDCAFWRGRKRFVKSGQWPSISSIYPSACCSFLSPGVSPGRGYDCQSSWIRTRLDHWQESDSGTATQQPVVPRRGCLQDWMALHNIQGRSWRPCYSDQVLSSPPAPYLLQVECLFSSLIHLASFQAATRLPSMLSGWSRPA